MTAPQLGAASSASGILFCLDMRVVLPVFCHCETTVATFGRLVDRFANGRLEGCPSVLDDYVSYPELAAAFDADTVQDVHCSECSTSQQQLMEEEAEQADGGAAPGGEQCQQCRELREARRNYDALRARFLSYFFWPALMDTQRVPESVELYPDPANRRPRSYYRRKKQRKPWVKKKWEERKRSMQALRSAAEPPAGVSVGDVAGTSGTQRPPQDNPEDDDWSNASD